MVYIRLSSLTGLAKLLGVTCNNTSNNDQMIERMADLIPGFGGQMTRVRCFAHILNFIAKSLILQFDVPSESEAKEAAIDKEELRELAEGSEIEEQITDAQFATQAGKDGDNTGNVDDEVDPMKDLSLEQRVRFKRDILPVKLLLAKVRLTVTK